MKRPRSPTLPPGGIYCTCSSGKSTGEEPLVHDTRVDRSVPEQMREPDREELGESGRALCQACRNALSVPRVAIGSTRSDPYIRTMDHSGTSFSESANNQVWPRMFQSWSSARAASRRMSTSIGSYSSLVGSFKREASTSLDSDIRQDTHNGLQHTNNNVFDLLSQRQCATSKGVHNIAWLHTRLEQWVERASIVHGEMGTVPIDETSRSTIAVTFSRCGKLIASTHGDHTVKLFCGETRRPKGLLTGHPRTPWTVKFDPKNSARLASGCLSGQVRIWDAETQSCTHMALLPFAVVSLAFHPSESWIVLASGNIVYLWDYQSGSLPAAVGARASAQSGSQPREFLARPKQVRCVVFAPCGTFFVTGEAAPSSDPFAVHTTNNREEATVQLIAWQFDTVNTSKWVSRSKGQDSRAFFGESCSELSLNDLRHSPRLAVANAVLYNDGGFDISPCGTKLCTIAYQGPGQSIGPNALDIASGTSAVSPPSRSRPQPKTSFASTTDEDEGEQERESSDAPIEGTTLGTSRTISSSEEASRQAIDSEGATKAHTGAVGASTHSGQFSNNTTSSRIRAMMLELNDHVNTHQGLRHTESPTKLRKIHAPIRKDSVGSVGSLQINSDEQSNAQLPRSSVCEESQRRRNRPPVSMPENQQDERTEQQLRQRQDQQQDHRQSHVGTEAALPMSRSSLARRREALQARHRQMLIGSGAESGPVLQSLRSREVTCMGSDTVPGTCAGVCKLAVFSLESERIGNVHLEIELDGALGQGITSVKFSPSSAHIIIGYGKHDRSRNVTHAVSSHASDLDAYEDRIAAIFEACPEYGLVQKRVLNSNQDDINTACFHPLVGNGVFLGTRRGRLRFLGFPRQSESSKL